MSFNAGIGEALAMRSARSGATFNAIDFAAALESGTSTATFGAGLTGAKRRKAVAAAADSPQIGVLSGLLGGIAPMLRGLGGETGSDVAELKVVVAKQSKELAALRASVEKLGKAKPGKRPNK